MMYYKFKKNWNPPKGKYFMSNKQLNFAINGIQKYGIMSKILFTNKTHTCMQPVQFSMKTPSVSTISSDATYIAHVSPW